jgi:hypothetical protein
MRAALVLLGLLPACAAPAVLPPRATTQPSRTSSAADDPLSELVAMLPVGVDRCVLARPSRIAAEQRERVARVSQGEPIAWLRELGVEAYASVSYERSDGPSAALVLARVSLAATAARELLDRRAGLSLQWSELRCSELACGPRARFIAPGLLRIERGVFPERVGEGAEVRCVKLAAQSPDAVEVSAARNRTLNDLPLRASTTLRATEAGVHLTRVELMPSMAIAAQAAREAEQLAPLYASNVRTQVTDVELVTELDVAFEDLELAEQDEARMRSAELEADAREQLDAVPASRPEPRAREDVLAELGYRLERASRVAGAERDAELAAARALLERSVAAQPDDEGLSSLLAELLVTELRDPAAARTALARFQRPGPAGQRVASLLRQAAAIEGEGALARELSAQQLVPRARAQSVARDVLTRVKAGASYLEAEQAALAAMH